jgi:hypothetical protein
MLGEGAVAAHDLAEVIWSASEEARFQFWREVGLLCSGGA